MAERRESKKRETRQRISDVATTLFMARGFEAVPLDEIAYAAKVSKMTVFNYFPRKEDLMLDREDELLLLPLREALHTRLKGTSPVDALRTFLDGLREQEPPFSGIESQTVGWWRVVSASPSLVARLHELSDEAAAALATEFGGAKPDGPARLMASMVVAMNRTALEEAFGVLERGGSAKKANVAFLALLDRGFIAIREMAQAAK